jgi:hypothetical protein
MMRASFVIRLVMFSASVTNSAQAAPPVPAKPPTSTATASTMRRPSPGELAELVRTALTASTVRLPKGTKILGARPSSNDLMVPMAPSRVTIDLTPPPRRAGPVTATAVLVFWKDAEVSARIPLHLDLSVPPEGLVFDVPKGGVVTIVVRRGLVEVSAQGVTAADADIGDVVQVLLRPSGRALRGEVIARDRVLAVDDGR